MTYSLLCVLPPPPPPPFFSSGIIWQGILQGIDKDQMRRLRVFSRGFDATLVVLSMALVLVLQFTIFENRGGHDKNRAFLAQEITGCPGKDKVAGTNASAKSMPASLSFDYYDQLNFKQPLHADCPHYGSRHGLFHPDTPHPRYIITGGAGFIGSHLVKALRAEGVHASQLKVVDNLWRGQLANLRYPNGSWAINATADFCALDLRNEKDTLKYIRGADVIYHLADIVAGVAYVFSHQESVFHDNILINTHTLKAAKENGIANYIYAGTACSFPKGLQEGPGIHALREDQTYPAEPESAYGWSKLMGEYEALLATDNRVFNVGLLRFHNVYGPYSDYSRTSPSQAIPSLDPQGTELSTGALCCMGIRKTVSRFRLHRRHRPCLALGQGSRNEHGRDPTRIQERYHHPGACHSNCRHGRQTAR